MSFACWKQALIWTNGDLSSLISLAYIYENHTYMITSVSPGTDDLIFACYLNQQSIVRTWMVDGIMTFMSKTFWSVQQPLYLWLIVWLMACVDAINCILGYIPQIMHHQMYFVWYNYPIKYAWLRFPRHRGLAIPTCRDVSCRVVMHTGITNLQFPFRSMDTFRKYYVYLHIGLKIWWVSIFLFIEYLCSISKVYLIYNRWLTDIFLF